MERRVISIAHKTRLNPTAEQAAYLWQCAGVARFTWNWTLAEYNRIKAETGEWPSILGLKREFNRLRREEDFAPFVAEVQCYANQYAFMDLQAAITRYWRLQKRGELKPPKGWKPRKDGRPFGWPRFKARDRTTPAFGIANKAMVIEGQGVTISKCPGGPINMAEPLRFEGKIMAGRVSHRAGRWYLAVSMQIDATFEAGSGAIGVDLGLKELAVTSDGERYQNPKRLKRYERKLARLQRRFSRQQKGSNGRAKTKNAIARLHAKIAWQRQAAIHGMTSELASRYEVVALENLNVRGMMKNHHLAGTVADASFYEIRRQLEYKTTWRNGQVVLVDQWYPSTKTCNDCGQINGDITLDDREWTCPSCGVVHDRDLNAARNIRDEGLRILNGTG